MVLARHTPTSKTLTFCLSPRPVCVPTEEHVPRVENRWFSALCSIYKVDNCFFCDLQGFRKNDFLKIPEKINFFQILSCRFSRFLILFDFVDSFCLYLLNFYDRNSKIELIFQYWWNFLLFFPIRFLLFGFFKSMYWTKYVGWNLFSENPDSC